MATLVPGKVVRSSSPTLTVENRLDAGAWRFRLVVVDDSGNESAPADLVVTVMERLVPPIKRPDPIPRDTIPLDKVARDTVLRDPALREGVVTPGPLIADVSRLPVVKPAVRPAPVKPSPVTPRKPLKP